MAHNDKYWCAFSRLTKVGSAFVTVLYNYFGSIEAAWNAHKTDVLSIHKFSKSQIDAYFDEKTLIDPDYSLDYIKQRNIDFIHLFMIIWI